MTAAVKETSSLLTASEPQGKRRGLLWKVLFALSLLAGIGLFFGLASKTKQHDKNQEIPLEAMSMTSSSSSSSKKPCAFPRDFLWGVATSSYQIEGAVDEDGRGNTIWDDFCKEPGAILDDSSGEIACDHYHRYKEDVQLMKSLNIQSYRFSIAWSRILPNGDDKDVNQAGIDFYNNLIDELLANDIEPWVTLYHWDLPSSLEERYKGWLGDELPDKFANYARIVFEHFGDRVKHWITINEAWSSAIGGYASGLHAPGHQSPTEPYIVAHHLLLAHAKAVHVYRTEFNVTTTQGGAILGMATSGDYRYPLDPDSESDRLAAERAMLFQLGWMTDPVYFGDYPKVMRERLGTRLPEFTEDERKLLIGSVDFVGLNYYSSFLASEPKEITPWLGYWTDIHVHFLDDESWDQNHMGWNGECICKFRRTWKLTHNLHMFAVAPDGLRSMLLWIKERYDDPVIYITENGSAERETSLQAALVDEQRRQFYEDHLMACSQAIHAGVNLKGFFAWSLMDNFEWQFGYRRRFGLCYVDFATVERTPKSSALWYNDTIVQNGRNIYDHDQSRQLAQKACANRQLPEKVLIGYGSDLEAVRKAVHHGVNVVTWAFIDFVRVGDVTDDARRKMLLKTEGIGMNTNLDIAGIRCLRTELCKHGYGRVKHLVSVGGWNGAHLDESVSAAEWYNAFKLIVGDVFDGIDWDLEGHDRMHSPTNYFTANCLHKMGAISRMAKRDGYLVSMAPPQSYLDFHGTNRFSRYINLTDPTRDWHDEFRYLGANVYAFLLAKYMDAIDLVSIQFYESYSRAAMMIKKYGVSPSDYLVDYAKRNLTLPVAFSDDPNVDMPDQVVELPLSKLVLGFANGWTDEHNDKTLFVPTCDIQDAWNKLAVHGSQPRGFMFWTIDLDGSNDLFFAHELSRVLSNYTD
ncbi:hypothetical protein MPSEU_000117600 [Mayamaea pseudoterrestris]|nr:hypothetical protein MPSEU_000117600 [Mayamaea pseudoterrestris]